MITPRIDEGNARLPRDPVIGCPPWSKGNPAEMYYHNARPGRKNEGPVSSYRAPLNQMSPWFFP